METEAERHVRLRQVNKEVTRVMQARRTSNLPLCEKCRCCTAIKTDSHGTDLCERCYLGIGDPIRGHSTPAGRNDPCPCKSGKKFKRCHGRG